MKNIISIFAISILFLSILYAENWPQFRGPSGQGISDEKNLPVRWSATDEILWKTEIPGEGYSSPIVFDQNIYITSAEDSGASCRVLCLDLNSGSILWNTEVFRQKPGNKEMRNSYATPTPVTDGKLVYAVYNDGSIAAVTTEGTLRWQNRNYKFYSQHGLGVSPILYENLFIIPFDGSGRPPDKHVGWQEPWDKAFILALDKSSGEQVWIGKRGLSRIAHVTPLIVDYRGTPQLVSGAGDVVQGFDPKTGTRIWSVKSSGEGVVPSIVSGEEMVFSASGFGDPTIRAILLGGNGDVTKTHIIWEQKDNVPTIPSFLYHKPYLFTITDNGKAMCLQAKTGEIVWQQRIPGKYAASPVYADGKIYFLSEKGTSTVIEAGPVFKIIAENKIEELCKASYAIANGKIIIRAEKHLYGIGNK
jgi:outer membrane protein assembly factor BamB